MAAANPQRRRCATYTRKSSEEGLEQDFNSLDAQRESCEAYIRSQAGEGWKPVRTRYDDGGYSGGTLDRPALGRLLEDIEAGKVEQPQIHRRTQFDNEQVSGTVVSVRSRRMGVDTTGASGFRAVIDV